jgi:hypothetical protein
VNLRTSVEPQFPAHQRSSVLAERKALFTNTAPPKPKSTPNSKLYLAPTGSKNAIVNLNTMFSFGPLHVEEFSTGQFGLSLKQYPSG